MNFEKHKSTVRDIILCFMILSLHYYCIKTEKEYLINYSRIFGTTISILMFLYNAYMIYDKYYLGYWEIKNK